MISVKQESLKKMYPVVKFPEMFIVRLQTRLGVITSHTAKST